MIRRERTHVAIPEHLNGLAIADELRRAQAYFGSKKTSTRQRPFDFDESLVNRPEIRDALWSLFDGRCAFCTQPLDGGQLVVHRFRPSQGAVGRSGDSSPRHYYWLSYAWTNLYPACEACTAASGSKFPVDGERAVVGAMSSSTEEWALLLDPCADDPEQDLVYLRSGEVVAESVRGRTTIDVYALNRRELIGQRAAAASEAVALSRRLLRLLEREDYRELLGLLDESLDHRAPFAAVRRQFVNQRVQLRKNQFAFALNALGLELDFLVGDLRRVSDRVARQTAENYYGKPSYSLAIEVTPSLPREISPEPVYDVLATRSVAIRSVEIRNFRVIESLHLEMASLPGDGTWTMLLGENGVGKTSVLQAIAVAMSGPGMVRDQKLTSSDLVRRGSKRGFIRVELAEVDEHVTVEIGRNGFEFEDSRRDSALFIAGYGATRLLPRTAGPAARYGKSHLDSLFNPFVALTPSRLWVPDLSETQFDGLARALLQLFPSERYETYLTRDREGQLHLVRDGRRMRLTQLSAGYQAIAALALDMIRLFVRQWDSLEAAEGVVLVDELDAHLHPRWQMQIVSRLRAAFPRVQFVSTTHSPLCLKGLRDGEVAALRLSEQGGTYALQDLPPIEGLSIDQLLTSEHFGLNSTVDPALEDDFNRYYALLAQRELSLDERDQLAMLRQRFAERRLYGETRREQLLLQAIDDYLAQEAVAANDVVHRELKSQTRNYLRELWAQGE